MIVNAVGDIHGKRHKLDKWLRRGKKVIQVGDLGFGDDWYYFDSPDNDLLVCRGNHDDGVIAPHTNIDLGDFGLIPGCERTFFIRGAWSIDQQARIPFQSWWPNEELSWQKADEALTAYENVKPEVMISHDCPESITHLLCPPPYFQTFTGRLLEEALKIHRPKLWLFGHYHVDRTIVKDGTKFVCLAEGSGREVELL